MISDLYSPVSSKRSRVLEMVVQDNDQISGSPVPGNKSKKGLDLFWKLARAKQEKMIIDWSSKILQNVSKGIMDSNFALEKLISSLAGSDASSKTSYFVCLTELMRQAQPEFATVSEIMKTALRPAGAVSKGEEANFLMARLLAFTATLRAGLDISQQEKSEIINQLGDISSSRSYMKLPAIKLCVEHFLPEEDLQDLIKTKFPIDADNLDLDSLYLLLSLFKQDPTDAYVKEKGLSKIAGKKSLGHFSSALIGTNLPPQEAAKHPGFSLLISVLTEKKAVSNFWQTFSSSMTNTNNKGILGWIFLRELSLTSLDLVPGLLTKHTLTVGSQLAVKKSSVGVVKEVFTKLSESKDDSINKLTIIKNLLDVDMCWDKLPLGGNVFNLASTSSPEVIKATAEIFVKTMIGGEWRLAERVHSAGMLTKLVGLQCMQGDLAWRQEILTNLASVSLLTGVPGVASLNSGGRDQMKDVLYRGLDSRNKCLGDSVTLLLAVVKYIEDQLSSGAMIIKQLNSDQGGILKTSLKSIERLDKKYKSSCDGESGVFLLLLSHMWLQMLTQPEMAAEIILELESVCQRWAKDTKEGEESEPEWIEVVTEVLISLLAQNNHLLRSVVASVFSVLGRELTGPAMASVLKVVQKKDEGDGLDEEDDADEEEEDIDEENNEGNESSEGEADKDGEDSEESEDDVEGSDEEDNNDIDEDLKKKVSTALGDHVAAEESDLEMDDIPDEELNRLDEKLVEAFKALGGRKDKRAKKKAEMQKVANMHFKLRALELVDIYLNHSPNPELIPSCVTSLVQALDISIKAGASKEPLVKRLKSTIGKICTVKFKAEDHRMAKNVGTSVLETLGGLLELANTGSVIVTNLGPAYPRLTGALLRLAQLWPDLSPDLGAIYEAGLESWLTRATCLLPTAVFSLATSHHWPGCWTLAARLASSAFSKDVRQYRRVGALSVLAGIVNNKVFRQEHSDQIRIIIKEILPKIADELNKIEFVEKAKPKYLEELFNILSNIQIADDTADYKEAISKKLEVMAKSWPSNRAFALCKKQLLRLLKNWNLKVDFSNKSLSNGNGIMKTHNEENGENQTGKRKKKKKQKSQDKLREAKEWKMKIARAQEDAEIPSFASLVEDNINAKENGETVVLSPKRKADKSIDDSKKQKLKKKKKA